MSYEEYVKERLWPALIETAHALVMFPSHKAYTRNVILSEKAETTAAELVNRLKIPLGEALVILFELAKEKEQSS